MKSFGECSFRFTAPSISNSLPASLWNLPTLSEFKTKLKAFLFGKAFHKPSVTIPVSTYYVDVCIYIYISVWMVCASSLIFCSAKRFAQYKSLSLLLLHVTMCAEKSPGRPSKYCQKVFYTVRVPDLAEVLSPYSCGDGPLWYSLVSCSFPHLFLTHWLWLKRIHLVQD